MYTTLIPLNESLLSSIEGRFTSSEVLFFDIETTGFSSKTTQLYLIGCLYFENNRPILKQWFAENPIDEPELLKEFFNFTKNYQYLVHYNGSGFDIPYLLQKCQQYNLPYDFSCIHSIDLYKSILPYKKFLKLDSLKQKSIENFLDINRNDIYSGGELISIYYEYQKTKSKELYELLLLHNHDDLMGLVQILPVLSYKDFLQGNFHITQVELNSIKTIEQIPSMELILTLSLRNPLSKRISFGAHGLYFTSYDHTCKMKISIYTGELKYFYPNYKDYYYLPLEDTAIHKSVAFYVDKDYRTKAKAANCYSKKTGRFLPQYKEIMSPYFKIDYFDKISYFELTDEYIKHPEKLHTYIVHIFECLKNS